MTMKSKKQSIALIGLLTVGLTATQLQATPNQKTKWTKKRIVATLLAGTAIASYAGYIGYNVYKGQDQDKATQALLKIGNAGLSLTGQGIIKLGKGIVDGLFGLASMACIKMGYESLQKMSEDQADVNSSDSSEDNNNLEQNIHQTQA